MCLFLATVPTCFYLALLPVWDDKQAHQAVLKCHLRRLSNKKIQAGHPEGGFSQLPKTLPMKTQKNAKAPKKMKIRTVNPQSRIVSIQHEPDGLNFKEGGKNIQLPCKLCPLNQATQDTYRQGNSTCPTTKQMSHFDYSRVPSSLSLNLTLLPQ